MPPEGFPWAFAGANGTTHGIWLATVASSKHRRKKMKRSVILIIGILTLFGFARSAFSATGDDYRRSNATVSFGLWETNPPLDRFFANPPAGAGNHHEMIPNTATIVISPENINDGGVNFIISGNHVLAIYDDGTRPEDINPDLLVPGITIGGGIIDDSNKRIYRGVNQTAATGARDRVEVVHFAKPGTYLVICAIQSHFVNDGMYGFVVAK
jgi:hypothetical protein